MNDWVPINIHVLRTVIKEENIQDQRLAAYGYERLNVSSDVFTETLASG